MQLSAQRKHARPPYDSGFLSASSCGAPILRAGKLFGFGLTFVNNSSTRCSGSTAPAKTSLSRSLMIVRVEALVIALCARAQVMPGYKLSVSCFAR
jgi:hypothetical protein